MSSATSWAGKPTRRWPRCRNPLTTRARSAWRPRLPRCSPGPCGPFRGRRRRSATTSWAPSALKAGDIGLRTIGGLSLVSQLLGAGLVDRLRLLVFPLIAGETGQEPAFARLPDIGLDLVGQSVLDERIVLSEYRPSGVPPYAS
jgi:RibD C-terminal domain